MTSSDRVALSSALSMFHEGSESLHLRCELFDLEINLRANQAKGHSELRRAIRSLRSDIWNLATIAVRLAWMRDMRAESQLHPNAWRLYCQLDIEAYFVQLRSALDYLTIAVASTGEKRGQLPSSFRKMREKIAQHRKKLAPALVPIYSEADWFDVLRDLRDGVVHEGREPLVFDDDQHVLFQVHDRQSEGMVSKPFLMFNENIAYFDRFAAWSFAHLLASIGVAGEVLAPQLALPMKLGPSRNHHPGFPLLRVWMAQLDAVLAELPEAAPAA